MLLRPRIANSSLRVLSHCRARRFYAASAIQAELQEETQDVPKLKKTRKPRARKEVEPQPEESVVADIHPWTRNLLEGTKVEEYLSSLSSEASVSIEDAERHRPKHHCSPDSPQYEEEYAKLVSLLCQSFSAKQLRQLCLLYNLPRRYSRTGRNKPAYASAIVEQQWKWPSLVDLRKHRALWSTHMTRMFPVSPTEMFFIIGHDGSSLLSLAGRHKVHISLSSNPLQLQLRVEGVQGALDNVGHEIGRIKSNLAHETFSLPVEKEISQQTLQRLSRTSNSFIENFGSPGTIRLTAKETRAIYTAKRLATRSVLEDAQLPPPLLTFLPAEAEAAESKRLFPVSYSLYPFMPARPLPWTVGSNRVFRARRVGEWLGIDGVEDISKTGGLRGGRGTVTELDGDARVLRDLLTESLGRSATVTAIVGHILIPSTPAQRATLSPPLQGNCSIDKINQFIRTHPSAPFFASSLPPSSLKVDSGPQNATHRLLYRTFPASLSPEEEQKRTSTSQSGISLKPSPVKFLQWEAVLPPETSQEPIGTGAQESPVTHESQGLDQNEVASGAPSSSPAGADLAANQSESSPPQTTGYYSSDPTVLKPSCKVGQEIVVNMMLPDRSLDLQLSARTETPIESSEAPFQLKDYLQKLETFLTEETSDLPQPNPPLSFHYEGEHYFLHSNLSVKKHNASIPALENSAESSPQLLSESILDLETMYKSSVCQVVCDGQGEEQWKDFLAGCDQLTSTTNRQPRTTSTPPLFQ